MGSLSGHIPFWDNLSSLFSYRQWICLRFSILYYNLLGGVGILLLIPLLLWRKLTFLSLNLEVSILCSCIISWAFSWRKRWTLVFLIWASHLQSFTKRWRCVPTFTAPSGTLHWSEHANTAFRLL